MKTKSIINKWFRTATKSFIITLFSLFIITTLFSCEKNDPQPQPQTQEEVYIDTSTEYEEEQEEQEEENVIPSDFIHGSDSMYNYLYSIVGEDTNDKKVGFDYKLSDTLGADLEVVYTVLYEFAPERFDIIDTILISKTYYKCVSHFNEGDETYYWTYEAIQTDDYKQIFPNGSGDMGLEYIIYKYKTTIYNSIIDYDIYEYPETYYTYEELSK